MNTSLKVNKLVILIVLIPFFTYTQEHSFTQKKKNTFFNLLALDFSSSYVSLTKKLNDTQSTYRELIFEEKLDQGIQYSVNLYYVLKDDLMLGFRYSLMEGSHETGQLFYDGFLMNLTAQEKIHFLGPVVAYRKFSYDLKFSYEMSYSFGYTSFLRVNSVQNSIIKYTANTYGIELGLAIYYQLTKHLALGGITGINASAFEKYRIESSNGVSHEKFEDDRRSSLSREYYGLSLRFKK